MNNMNTYFSERLRITESKISYSLHKFYCFEVNQIYLMIKIKLKRKKFTQLQTHNIQSFDNI